MFTEQEKEALKEFGFLESKGDKYIPQGALVKYFGNKEDPECDYATITKETKTEEVNRIKYVLDYFDEQNAGDWSDTQEFNTFEKLLDVCLNGWYSRI